MNKLLNLALSLILAFVMVLGLAGPVFAQTPTPPAGGSGAPQNPGLLQSIAQALQMGISDLQTALKNGQTIAQLASQKGIDLKTLITTLTSQTSQRLQQAVSGGQLTQDQANQRLDTLQSDLNTWFTTGTPPADLKAVIALRQANKAIADALGMSVKDLNAAIKSGKTIAQLAQEKGVSLDSVVTAAAANRAQQLQKAVQAGKITQDQADKTLSKLKDNLNQWFTTGKRPNLVKAQAQAAKMAETLAQQLGMTTADLKQALKNGQTIAQLAQEKGVSIDSLVTALGAQRTNAIQQALQAGKITQDQANKMLDKLKKNLTNRLENGPKHKNTPNTPSQTTPQAGTPSGT